MSAFDRLSKTHTYSSAARKTEKALITPAPIKTKCITTTSEARNNIEQRPQSANTVRTIGSNVEKKPIFFTVAKNTSIESPFGPRKVANRPRSSRSDRTKPKSRDEKLVRKPEKKTRTKPNGTKSKSTISAVRVKEPSRKYHFPSLVGNNIVSPDIYTSQPTTTTTTSQDAESITSTQVSSISKSQSLCPVDVSDTINTATLLTSSKDIDDESKDFDPTTSGEKPSQEHCATSPVNNHDDRSVTSSPPAQESELVPPQHISRTCESHSPSAVGIKGDASVNSVEEEREDDECEAANSNDNNRDIDIENSNASKEATGGNVSQESRPPSPVRTISSLLLAHESELMSPKPIAIASESQSSSEANSMGHLPMPLPSQTSTHKEREEENLDLPAPGEYPSQESSSAISLLPPAQGSDLMHVTQVSSTYISQSSPTIESSGQQEQKAEEYGVTNSCGSSNETKESHEYSPDQSSFRKNRRKNFLSPWRVNVQSSHYRIASSPREQYARRSNTVSSLNSIKSILKKQQERTLLLVHAANCTDDNCHTIPHCTVTKKQWKHMKTCSDEDCEVYQCISSRNILSHYHSCTNMTCQICSPARSLNNNLGNIKGDSISLSYSPSAISSLSLMPSRNNSTQSTVSSVSFDTPSRDNSIQSHSTLTFLPKGELNEINE